MNRWNSILSKWGESHMLHIHQSTNFHISLIFFHKLMLFFCLVAGFYFFLFLWEAAVACFFNTGLVTLLEILRFAPTVQTAIAVLL